jgi:hypothetical protein
MRDPMDWLWDRGLKKGKPVQEEKPSREKPQSLNEAREGWKKISEKHFNEVRALQKAKHMRMTPEGPKYADAMHAYKAPEGHLVYQYYSHPAHGISTVEQHYHSKTEKKHYQRAKPVKEDLNEEGDDMLGLHGKTMPVKTDHFEGHAHISFDRIKSGRHKQHSYKVEYKGKGGHPDVGEKEDHNHTSFMSVDHDNGRPYKFRDHPHSSKDLHTLLHKAAPRWVKLSDLQPKPSNA